MSGRCCHTRWMIDWPNALVGFALGVVATLLFWIPDRIRAGRQRRAETWESWKVAMKDLELLMWKPETRGADVYVARTRYPIDLWRAVLDDREGFMLLERAEGAYPSIEHYASRFASDPSPENNTRFLRAQDEWQAGRVAFANYSRNAQSEGYHQLVQREERQKNRRDLLRHPIKTMRRIRHNARMRKATW